LIEELNVGPVHLTGQDIAGATVLRLAATYPEDVGSFTAIEMGLPGFGLELLADVTHGGTWHIGVLAAPGIPEMLLAGHEREFLGQFAFPAMSATPGAITDTDIDEFVRTYSRADGWRGAIGLYQSMLEEGDKIATLVADHMLNIPVLAIGAGGGEFTLAAMSQVSFHPVRSVRLEGVGHYAALEEPDQVAHALLEFFSFVGHSRA
jgi:pimeloyl-ACP methyl ester carboxylesterase